MTKQLLWGMARQIVPGTQQLTIFRLEQRDQLWKHRHARYPKRPGFPFACPLNFINCQLIGGPIDPTCLDFGVPFGFPKPTHSPREPSIRCPSMILRSTRLGALPALQKAGTRGLEDLGALLREAASEAAQRAKAKTGLTPLTKNPKDLNKRGHFLLVEAWERRFTGCFFLQFRPSALLFSDSHCQWSGSDNKR